MIDRNKRRMLSLFWAVLGAAVLVLSLMGVLDSSLYAGMGGALMAIGILQSLRHEKYRRDPEYREKVDIEENDERNRFLRLKSWAWTGYLVVLAEAIGSVIAMALGKETVQMVLMYSVCLIVFVYWVCYMVLNRKY